MKTFLGVSIILVCVVDIILILMEDGNPVFFSRRALTKRICIKIVKAVLWSTIGFYYLTDKSIFWASVTFLMAILDIAIIILIIWQRKKHKKDWKNLNK